MSRSDRLFVAGLAFIIVGMLSTDQTAAAIALAVGSIAMMGSALAAKK